MRHQRSLRHRSSRTLVAALICLACSDDGTGPPDPPAPPAAEVNQLIASLGSWSEFAPLQPSANVAAGEESERDETVQEPDVSDVLQPVVYTCRETPYSLTSTPDDIVMYSPNAGIMWVGNLIQGQSYRDGVGSFAELSIRQRDTLRISIDLLTLENSATVPLPSLTTVQSAIGDLIQRATNAGHRSGSSINYEEQLTHSVEQAALALGISARYLGGKAKSDLQVSRKANERTLVAHFVQKMFTISIEQPQSPADFFSSALTQALLQQQIDEGTIGANNPPVYIASVTYGRILTYSLTSSHGEHRMRAAISASYNGLAGGAAGYTAAELQETLSEQNIKVTAIGGDGQSALNLISSGRLKDYFTDDAPLTTARPLAYQLNYLGDNQVAKVSETTTYTLSECAPKPAAGGRFDFLPVQQGAAPVPTPYDVLKGDFNGDGRSDLLWNHLVSGSNRMSVGFGQVDGTFDIRPASTHTMTPPEGWGNGYTTHIGDFDNDGRDDIMWNRVRGGSANRFYIAISNGDGTFTFRNPRTHPTEPAWADGWKTHVGDLDGDGRTDIIWNYLNGPNHTFTALTLSDTTFTFSARMTHPSQGFQPYTAHIGDVDGDGDDDITWNKHPVDNWNHYGRSNGNGTLNLSMSAQSFGSSAGWGGYTLRTGDVNRDGRLDMIWAAHGAVIYIHRALGESTGRFRHLEFQTHDTLNIQGTLETLIGDFNGDGSSDILFNDLGASRNFITIGQGNVDGGFDFSPTPQEHPQSALGEDWTAFRGGVIILDVNGDCRDDLVWNERAVSNRIYVALARGAGSCSAGSGQRHGAGRLRSAK